MDERSPKLPFVLKRTTTYSDVNGAYCVITEYFGGSNELLNVERWDRDDGLLMIALSEDDIKNALLDFPFLFSSTIFFMCDHDQALLAEFDKLLAMFMNGTMHELEGANSDRNYGNR